MQLRCVVFKCGRELETMHNVGYQRESEMQRWVYFISFFFSFFEVVSWLFTSTCSKTETGWAGRTAACMMKRPKHVVFCRIYCVKWTTYYRGLHKNHIVSNFQFYQIFFFLPVTIGRNCSAAKSELLTWGTNFSRASCYRASACHTLKLSSLFQLQQHLGIHLNHFCEWLTFQSATNHRCDIKNSNVWSRAPHTYSVVKCLNLCNANTCRPKADRHSSSGFRFFFHSKYTFLFKRIRV